MGWNDRLPEDPNIPYESQADQDSYEYWRMYVEGLLDEEKTGTLTSNNIQPGDVFDTPATVTETQDSGEILARLRELAAQTARSHENQDSRQPTHHQEK